MHLVDVDIDEKSKSSITRPVTITSDVFSWFYLIIWRCKIYFLKKFILFIVF